MEAGSQRERTGEEEKVGVASLQRGEEEEVRVASL